MQSYIWNVKKFSLIFFSYSIFYFSLLVLMLFFILNLSINSLDMINNIRIPWITNITSLDILSEWISKGSITLVLSVIFVLLSVLSEILCPRENIRMFHSDAPYSKLLVHASLSTNVCLCASTSAIALIKCVTRKF